MPPLKYVSMGLAAISVLSFAAGYLREVTLALMFGAGPVTDAFMASYSFIVSFNEFTFGAMLSASIIPVLVALPETRKDHASWQNLVSALSVCIVAITGVLAFIIYLFFPFILHVLAPGFNAETYALALEMGRHMVLLLPCQALLFLFILTLNTRHHYLLPACGTLLTNLLFSALIMLLHKQHHYAALPIAVLSGTGLTLVLLAWRLYTLGAFRGIAFSAAVMGKLWRLSRPMLFSLGLGSSIGLLMASHLILRYYASYMGTGAVAALGFGFRIYEVPLTLIANTTATLTLPAFSSMHAAGHRQRMAEICRQMITWGVVILLPIAMVVYLHAEWIVRVLLERGNFDHQSALLTAAALKGFTPAIVFEAGFVVFFRVFYALHLSKIPMRSGIATVIILLCLLHFLHVRALQDIAFCLSAAFACACVFVVGNAVHIFGKQSFPPLALLAKPVVVAFLLFFFWPVLFTVQEGFLLPALSAMSFMTAYAACLCLLMPQQRRQAFRLLAR